MDTGNKRLNYFHCLVYLLRNLYQAKFISKLFIEFKYFLSKNISKNNIYYTTFK